ncbi:Hypothetical protein A7982_01202 [Minicystis rosea]|nr:Hypothetical protein A7982_01202 [Minicystis rosea]
MTDVLVPSDAHGADLFWWRRDGGFRTLVTIYGPLWAAQLGGARLRLKLAVFDVAGRLQASGETSLGAAEALLLDQERLASVVGKDVGEGVLAVFPVGAAVRADSSYGRLKSLCDWISEEGDIVSFHNDQSWLRGDDQSWLRGIEPLELTEVVILASSLGGAEIVMANGPDPQPPGCLRLWVQNHRGARRYATYAEAMNPFSLARARLDSLFPGLEAFVDGEAATVSGRLTTRDLFVRPWVVTYEPRLSAYHGGNRYGHVQPIRTLQNWHLPYRWSWLEPLWPRAARALTHAKMNPGAVIQGRGLTTVVNVLNSHGAIEEDFWVDVRLHDAAGRLVAKRERWLLARRHGVARGEIRDLLPDPGGELVGHVALTFSRAAKLRFPQLLQALFEYRTERSTARTMLWSDAWNTVPRLRQRGIALRAIYRALARPPLLSHVIVSNCGMAADYDHAASLRIVLEDGRGRSLVREETLPPHGTLFASLLELFPDARDFLGEQPGGIVVVESAFDLASLHFTLHETTGAWSVEHNMALWTQSSDRRWHAPSGI